MFLWIWIFTVIFSLLVTVVFFMDICTRTERKFKVNLGYIFKFKTVIVELFTTLWGLKLLLFNLIPVANIVVALIILFAGDKFLNSNWKDLWTMANKEEE